MDTVPFHRYPAAMSVTIEDVRNLAVLARIRATDAELEHYQKQLDAIVSYVAEVREVNVTDVEEMGWIDDETMHRLDEPVADPYPDRLVAAAPKHGEGFVFAPPVRLIQDVDSE